MRRELSLGIMTGEVGLDLNAAYALHIFADDSKHIGTDPLGKNIGIGI